MFGIELKKNTELTEKLSYVIKEFRIETELNYHKAEYEKRAPKEVEAEDGFFKKLKKNTGNAFNKSEYENHLNAYNDMLKKNDEFKEEFKKYENYNIDNVFEITNELFKNDKFGVAKIEFAMNVVLDNSFTFECNETTFPKISTILGYETSFMKNLKEKLVDAYSTIGLDKTLALKNAFIAGGVVIGVGLVASGLGAAFGLASGAATGFTLSSAVFAALSLGSIAGGITYVSTLIDEKDKLREEFGKLTLEETVLSVSKTIVLLKQLDLYKNEADAKKLYDAMVEEYIDLKSDLDLRILVGREDLELNNKKSEVFHNADTYLKKELNLA